MFKQDSNTADPCYRLMTIAELLLRYYSRTCSLCLLLKGGLQLWAQPHKHTYLRMLCTAMLGPRAINTTSQCAKIDMLAAA